MGNSQESLLLLRKKTGSRNSPKGQLTISLKPSDFLPLTQLAVDKLTDPALSAAMAHMLLGYFMRVAILEYEGRETTHAVIKEKYDVSLNTVTLALARLVTLGLLEKVKAPMMRTNGMINTYRVPREMLIQARNGK